MSFAAVASPHPTFRLIPARFPPISAFETVASASDLAAVIDLAGWTDDRLVAERLARLPPSDWVFGVTNASVIMGAFLHAAPGGSRFNGPELGAWYASAARTTAVAEVAHHLRREAVARHLNEMRRVFQCYVGHLVGVDFTDLRRAQAARPDLYDGTDYAASQAFGEATRRAGGCGLVYDSLRHAGGVSVVAYRPRLVSEVVQVERYDILATTSGKVLVTTLNAPNAITPAPPAPAP